MCCSNIHFSYFQKRQKNKTEKHELPLKVENLCKNYCKHCCSFVHAPITLQSSTSSIFKSFGCTLYRLNFTVNLLWKRIMKWKAHSQRGELYWCFQNAKQSMSSLLPASSPSFKADSKYTYWIHAKIAFCTLQLFLPSILTTAPALHLRASPVLFTTCGREHTGYFPEIRNHCLLHSYICSPSFPPHVSSLNPYPFLQRSTLCLLFSSDI